MGGDCRPALPRAWGDPRGTHARRRGSSAARRVPEKGAPLPRGQPRTLSLPGDVQMRLISLRHRKHGQPTDAAPPPQPFLVLTGRNPSPGHAAGGEVPLPGPGGPAAGPGPTSRCFGTPEIGRAVGAWRGSGSELNAIAIIAINKKDSVLW